MPVDRCLTNVPKTRPNSAAVEAAAHRKTLAGNWALQNRGSAAEAELRGETRAEDKLRAVAASSTTESEILPPPPRIPASKLAAESRTESADELLGEGRNVLRPKAARRWIESGSKPRKSEEWNYRNSRQSSAQAAAAAAVVVDPRSAVAER